MNEDQFRLINETEDYMVVYKPAGLLIHTATGKTEITLADLIVKYYPEIIKVGDDPMRPGIVHRLDQEVSGLLVVAKNQTMFENLKNQFQDRRVKKVYQALIFNWPKDESGQIDLPIGRSGKGVKMSANHGKDLKPALTEYKVLQKYVWDKQKLALVEVKLHTGRTHQIRLHFQSQGHPLVGDTLYKVKRVKQPENFKRIFLQAVELGFHDLNNREQNFKLELDIELQDLLKSFQVV
jgi:23S rRNA pseudouridine1911/1915/1917 synthase